ncbi:wall-associated receptor kinase-like 8 [Lactuca sativa]|uniref:Protein kinase domain-containing protein n=1 Tax=Lactuca sativa TaxID=4236 RepID=A0A9R1W929_LACSA|nr:wall-associated receptor kinase-like 8 [Lactuca sativa]XP_042755139.1 wall-associated receptor kinase-like 8 [Lactuca sativa]KAJ0220745.1 hypothetical protein LSAT_V11C200072670 [Lactuca sativa]
MKPFKVLQLLILTLLTSSIEAQLTKPRCDTACGDVQITYPFGIGRECSANEWYTINCNSSTPYLSALNNVEVLVLDINLATVTVNISLISVDCQNPVQYSHLILNTSYGNSPFLFSASNNILIVNGCGSAAIMENGTVVGGCSTTCGTTTNTVIVTDSDTNNCFGIGCCQTTIPHDLHSFTLNLTGMEKQDRDGTCSGSAFLVAADYAREFSSQFNDNFAPISLSWNETFDENSIRCNETCGDVSIPYPFGIERSCSESDWFNVDCNSSTPYLSAFNNLEVLGISLENETLTVNVPMFSNCENLVYNNSLNLNGSPFRFSGSYNILVVEGCGSAAIMYNGSVVSGCSTTCGNDIVIEKNNCFGIGCCQTMIPDYLQSFTYDVTGLKRQTGNKSCGSAFMVDMKSFLEGRMSQQFVPVTLGWWLDPGLLIAACDWCRRYGGFCQQNYTEGGGWSRRCIYRERRNTESHTGVIEGVSISMGSLLLMVIVYVLYTINRKTKAKMKTKRYFKRNGGILLKQQQATDIGLVDKTILFTSNELSKATDNFNENRILGRGGQGTVYKGMLSDGRIVAIKKSKVVDESQLEQFINEVVILSQVNHRNVVKLLGCCLETEVPLLVSEFISNGTLYDFIQDETNEFSISLNMRLQIATEVAGALSYLHSSTSTPIYHRDIKTTNILLDEKYRAKVSDFGTSRFVSLEQTHLTTLVKGTFGYLDPEYFQSSQFTEKSDVYSFGVVLLELLTREKPISLTKFGEHRSLVAYFMEAVEEGRVLSILDAMVVKEGSMSELLAIANLALRCLNLNGKNRPTMKEVSIELEGMRLSHVPFTIQTSFGHVKNSEELPQIYSGSTSTSFTFNDLCR